MSLETVESRLVEACSRSGRRSSEVTLIAVSKGRSSDDILALYETGHRDFGENRAQELRTKVAELPADIRWHFIGPLQTNKARTVRPAVTELHSMDRVGLATTWMKGQGVAPDCYLQVNIGREDQKSGIDPDDVVSVLDEMLRLGVPIRGLMAIPPLAVEGEASRRYFIEMREMRDSIVQIHPEIVGLSMGMTNDYEIAIEEGATAIRVGRAIFDN